MKVYVVYSLDTSPDAVFSTVEKAIDYMKRENDDFSYVTVIEYEIDAELKYGKEVYRGAGQ